MSTLTENLKVRLDSVTRADLERYASMLDRTPSYVARKLIREGLGRVDFGTPPVDGRHPDLRGTDA